MRVKGISLSPGCPKSGNGLLSVRILIFDLFPLAESWQEQRVSLHIDMACWT